MSEPVPDDGAANAAPKLFISYGWTSSEHMEWVLELASELRTNGVDVILDKWHLREGQDAHAFMEQMVSDPAVRKVGVICDAMYADKANDRVGGVGTESQIMSPEIFGSVDQTKFVAIAREKDDTGRPFLPVFFRSRIYIDLTEGADRVGGVEQLLRWCFDKPLHIAPEVGPRPTFLDEQDSAVAAGATRFRAATRRYSDSPTVALSSLREFLQGFVMEARNLIVEPTDRQVSDDVVFSMIEGLRSSLEQFLGVVDRAMQMNSGPEVENALHEAFEGLLALYDAGAHTWSADVVKFLTHFAFAGAVLLQIQNNRGDKIELLTDVPYYIASPHDRTGKGATFVSIRPYLESLDHRTRRLNLRRLSLHADIIVQFLEGSRWSITEFMQAELVLYLRDHIQFGNDGHRRIWWPISLLYAANTHGAFPIFIRAEGKPGWDRLLTILGTERGATLREFIEWAEVNPKELPHWEFERPRFRRLMNFDQIQSRIT